MNRDFKPIGVKQAELIEISNKYLFFKKRVTKWYLKPFYELAYILSVFIAKKNLKTIHLGSVQG